MPEADAARVAVDGEDGEAWHLPLPPLNATSLPEPYSPGMPCVTRACSSACWPALQRISLLKRPGLHFN